MAHLSRSVATLRISGDELLPDEITKILGCQPTHGQIKGEVIVGKKTGRERVVKIGMWRLCAEDCEPENIDAQVSEMLNKLSNDLAVWKKLSEKYELDLFCGLFMEESNEGLAISPATLYSLGARGIELGLDIYDPVKDENA